MKKLNLLLGGAAFVAMTSPALAAGLSANGAITTNYVWRGVSQSSNDPAVQGGFDYDLGNGFAVGTWASSIAWYGDSPLELDVYGSYTGAITNELGWTVGAIGYLYPNADSSLPTPNFWEPYVGLNWTVDTVALSGKVYYSDDNLGSKTWYYTGGVTIPLDAWLSFSANYGHYTFDPGTDYTDWNLGLAATWKFLTFSATYVDNDLSGSIGKSRVVGMVSVKVSE